MESGAEMSKFSKQKIQMAISPNFGSNFVLPFLKKVWGGSRPEVEFVTAVTAGGNVKFLPAV